MANMFPFLRYRDAPAAIDWLVRAFGFTRHLVVPGEDGTIAHAELKLGPGVVMVGSAGNRGLTMKTPGELGGVGQGIYVHIPEIDAHYSRAREAGARVVQPITDSPHGSRDYSALDLEGYLWSFGTYLPKP